MLDGLARYLADAGLGVYRTTGTYSPDEVAITTDYRPASPDRMVTLTQYAGSTSDSGLGVDEPRVQIRVRGTSDPAWSRQHAQAIYDALHGLARVTLPDGTYVVLAVCQGSGPAYLGQDSNDRHEHVLNVAVAVSNPNRLGR